MKNAVILHGTDASPDDHWFRWLQGELEERGYSVWLPQLPGAERPSAQRYNKFLLNGGFGFNEDTILIGHSSGAVSILNLLQVLPGNFMIKASFLVGAFRGDLGWNALKEIVEPLDFDKIKSRCGKFIFIHSDD